jgi:hypothetical protein
VAYLRVSGKQQVGGDRFPRQREAVERYAKAAHGAFAFLATRRERWIQPECSFFSVDRRARMPGRPCSRPFALHSSQHSSHMKHWQSLHHRPR